MTAQITINIIAESAAEAREEMARLLGTVSMNVTVEQKPTVEQAVAAVMCNTAKWREMPATEEAAPVEAQKRERGKPAPGRARRTKEEIAEDEAADRLSSQSAEEHVAEVEAQMSNISTGEERIDPTTAEDAAQDKADEQAEAETTAPVELTHDSVRAVLGSYVKAYGMEATMVDGPAIFAELFGEGKAKVSDIPDTREALAQAVAAVEAAINLNRFSRKAVF